MALFSHLYTRISYSLIALIFLLASCSPVYVIQAGYQEAAILLGRNNIAKLLKDPKLESETKEKFELVLASRSFAENIGLKPKESFTTYSKVDQDVLTWVLSASEKTSLTSVTWWFPIIGRLPYKGFFDKSDALHAFNNLKDEGFDVYLRPASAFSTLGWFNDPLISTTLKQDLVSLNNIVIHEIVHRTIWIPNQVEFNETLANVIASLASIEFFRTQHQEKTDKLAAEAESRLADEIEFAEFIEETINKLTLFYASLDHEELKKNKNAVEKVLNEREMIIYDCKAKWAEKQNRLQTGYFKNTGDMINNAYLIANRVYTKKFNLFISKYKNSQKPLKDFIELMVSIAQESKDSDKDPFVLLETIKVENK